MYIQLMAIQLTVTTWKLTLIIPNPIKNDSKTTPLILNIQPTKCPYPTSENYSNLLYPNFQTITPNIYKSQSQDTDTSTSVTRHHHRNTPHRHPNSHTTHPYTTLPSKLPQINHENNIRIIYPDFDIYFIALYIVCKRF
jgi:hypothetical protein